MSSFETLRIAARSLSLARLFRATATVEGLTRYLLAPDQRRNLTVNMAAAMPDKSTREIRHLCRRWFIANARDAFDQRRLETLSPEQMARERSRVRVIGREFADQVYNDARPVILVTPHYGNFMLGALWVAAQHSRHGVYFFYNPPERNAYAEMSNRLLDQPENGCHKIYNNSHGLKTALKALRAGGTLCMMPDLISVTASALYVPFFGRFFTAMAGIAFLAAKTNAHILPVYCYPADTFGRNYILEFRKPLMLDSGARAELPDIIYRTMSELFQELERQIRLLPDHWRYWHIYLKRSLAFPLIPNSEKQLRDLLISDQMRTLIGPDQDLALMVGAWAEALAKDD